MITMDAGRRSARLEELLEELGRRASAEDRDLLLSFARVVSGEREAGFEARQVPALRGCDERDRVLGGGFIRRFAS